MLSYLICNLKIDQLTHLILSVYDILFYLLDRIKSNKNGYGFCSPLLSHMKTLNFHYGWLKKSGGD